MPEGEYRYDEATHILYLGCPDNYDGLCHKTKYAVRALVRLFSPKFIIKTDDDVSVNVEKLHEYLRRPELHANSYEGFTWVIEGASSHGIQKYENPDYKTPTEAPAIRYCCGPMYYLGANAAKIVGENMDPCRIKFEDLNVGLTLEPFGITANHTNLYHDDRAMFDAGETVGWHNLKMNDS